MLTVFFYSLSIVLLFTPFGLILSNENKKNLGYFSSQLLYGLIILSFIALFLNFFFPLSKILNTLILIIPITLIFFFRKIYLNKQFLLFLISSGTLITLLILESNVYRPDAGLYHLPYIKILNDEKIIFGLANFHFRYAHISIVQYTSAISNNLFFGNNGIVFVQALIATSIMINFIFKIYEYNKDKNFNFHFFFLISSIIFISYKMNRYSEYGNDAPSHFLFFFLVSEILDAKKREIKDICNNLLLILFIILNKITLILSIFLFFINIKDINLKKLLKIRRFYFLIIFALLWLTKNLFISGCILYPVKNLCFDNLLWADLQKVEDVSLENEAWTKGWPDYTLIQTKANAKIVEFSTYIKNFYWLPYWSSGHLKKILSIIIPYVLFLSALVLFLNYKKKSLKDFKFEKKYHSLIIILFFSTLVWLVKVPVFRYGYSYLVSFISLTFAYVCINFDGYKIKIEKLFNLILIFCIIVLFSKNILRIHKNENNYYNYPWPKYYGMNDLNSKSEIKKIILNGKTFFMPKKGYCSYSLSPCGSYGIPKDLNLSIIKGYYILYINSNK